MGQVRYFVLSSRQADHNSCSRPKKYQSFTVCVLNSQVNKLKGSSSTTVSGWTFNGVKNGGSQNLSNHFRSAINATEWGCPNASWFAWAWPEEGSINTTLHGKGEAILEYGNCHKRGNVAVHLNGIRLSDVGPKKEVQVGFEFNDGDVLQITEYKAIIQFNYLRIVGCPEGISFKRLNCFILN